MGVNCLIFSGNSEGAYNTNNVSIRQLSAGAYRIAAQLRENGFTVQVVDFATEQQFSLIHKLVLRKFVDKDTYWIGFSNNFVNHILGYPYVITKKRLDYLKLNNQNIDREIKKFIEYARELNPNIQFVIGGTRLIDLSHLNFFEFRGYADTQIVAFTKALQNKTIPSQKVYNYEIYENFTSCKIDYLPCDILNYYQALSIEISRGCIFKCKFCAHPLNGKPKGDWIKKSEILYEEFITNYERYGITNYVFADDTYNDSPGKVQLLYEQVFSKLPFKINFVTYLRLDLLLRWPHTIDLLKASGLKAAFFGIETLNPVAAKIIGKGVEPSKLIDFATKLKSDQFHNINMHASWILGLPTDTQSSITRMCEWIISNDNPFDSNSFAELGIKPKNMETYQVFKSPFEDDIFQYKFDVYHDDHFKLEWKYSDTGLTSQWCKLQAQTFKNIEIPKRRRLHPFIYPDLVTLGIDPHDYWQLTPEEFFSKYPLAQMQKNMNKKYLQNLMLL